MPGIADFLSGNSAAEQIFVWGVFSQVLGELLEPFLRATLYKVNANDPNGVLTPAQLADMVMRGHIDQAAAAAEAQQTGINNERFGRMVASAGEAPGPEELAEALRRNIIPETGDGAEAVSFDQGIRETRLNNKWTDTIKELSQATPSFRDAVEALVRSMISDSTARDYYTQFGGDPQYFDLLFDIAGEGPSPIEAGQLANRGIIPWEGTGPNATSFEQAVAESRFKTKWTAAFKESVVYKPPPRTITAMYREGSIDQERATRLLLDYGVKPEMVPTYLTKTVKAAVQKAHEVSETEILRLYEEEAISKQEAADFLKKHGYPDADIPIILAAADLQNQLKTENAAVSIVRGLYVKGRIDATIASAQLANAQVPHTRAAHLIQIWELEREQGHRDLTVKQITDAGNAGIISQAETLTRLQAVGYSGDDAALLMALMYRQPTPAGGATLGNFTTGPVTGIEAPPPGQRL